MLFLERRNWLQSVSHGLCQKVQDQTAHMCLFRHAGL